MLDVADDFEGVVVGEGRNAVNLRANGSLRGGLALWVVEVVGCVTEGVDF